MNTIYHLLPYSIFWIISGIFFYGLSVIPCCYLVLWALSIHPILLSFVLPVTFFLLIMDLMLLTWVIKRLFIPDLKEGEYSYSTDPHAFHVWIANRWVTEYLMGIFIRLMYKNDLLRYLCLRLFGVRLHFSTMISSDRLSDYSLLKFGKNTRIGAWATIYGHVQPEENKLILARTEIGDYTFVGANSVISPGARIGNNVFLGYYAVIGLHSRIGNNCRIGWHFILGHKCIIEDDVVIGRHCLLGNSVQVKKGLKIPGFSTIPDHTVIDSQEKANAFILINSPSHLEQVSKP